MTETLTKQLRDAAKQCSNVDYRQTLRDAADQLEEAIDELFAEPTRDSMIALNGAWAYAERVLKNVPEEADPTPLSGSTAPAVLAMAA